MAIDNIVNAVTKTVGKVHLLAPVDVRQHERILCPTSAQKYLFKSFSIFIHITENFFHLRVADGLVEVDGLDARGVNESQQRQHQQQSTEAGNLRWKLRPAVLGEHHLKG